MYILADEDEITIFCFTFFKCISHVNILMYKFTKLETLLLYAVNVEFYFNIFLTNIFIVCIITNTIYNADGGFSLKICPMSLKI